MAGARSLGLVHGHAERVDFDALYRRYAEPVYGFCLRRTRDAELAEDARAMVFLEAWRRRRDVDLTSRPAAPWLYGVARNVLRNQQRALRRRDAALWSLQRVEPPQGEEVSERVQRRAQLDALLGSLRSLSPAQREVVGMCLLEDRSYEAAAGALRIPVGTVRSRLSRARLRLTLDLRAAEGDATTPTT
jgi:RNA polymerase sigma-70 factor (ECF subfamily)